VVTGLPADGPEPMQRQILSVRPCCRAVSSWSHRLTRPPSATMRRATDRPMPEAPPAITAQRPLNRCWGRSFEFDIPYAPARIVVAISGSTWPPSMTMVWPLASSEARKRTLWATSSGVPRRRNPNVARDEPGLLGAFDLHRDQIFKATDRSISAAAEAPTRWRRPTWC